MTAGSVHTPVNPRGARPPRPRWRHVGALAVVAAVLSLGGSAVRADQTVYFDDAGDAPHISLIGDSTLTGVRWYADCGKESES